MALSNSQFDAIMRVYNQRQFLNMRLHAILMVIEPPGTSLLYLSHDHRGPGRSSGYGGRRKMHHRHRAAPAGTDLFLQNHTSLSSGFCPTDRYSLLPVQAGTAACHYFFGRPIYGVRKLNRYPEEA